MEAFLNIPRVNTGIAEWCACMVYLLMLKRKMTGRKFAVVAVTALVIQIMILVLTDNAPLWLWVPCMGIAVLLMYAFIYKCGDGNRLNSAFYCVKAFVMAEFAAAAQWHIFVFFWPDGQAPVYVHILFLIIIFGLIFGLASLEKKYYPHDVQLGFTGKEVISAIFVGVMVFAISNISFVSVNTPFSGKYGSEISFIRMLVDLGGVGYPLCTDDTVH